MQIPLYLADNKFHEGSSDKNIIKQSTQLNVETTLKRMLNISGIMSIRVFCVPNSHNEARPPELE